jgi:prepilin-type N-terminal cleavage/methylation domain-containing protein
MSPSKRREGFTLVEIMIVIAIIGIIIAIASTTWIRQREMSRARACQENLTKIEGAKEQYAMDAQIGNGEAITGEWDVLVGTTRYLKSQPVCPADGVYTLNVVGTTPVCNYVVPSWLSIPHQVP